VAVLTIKVNWFASGSEKEVTVTEDDRSVVQTTDTPIGVVAETVQAVSASIIGGRDLEEAVYDQAGLTAVLSKQYLLEQNTWSAASGVGTSLTAISFPRALWMVASEQYKLNNYRHFRGEVEVEVKFSAARTCGGSLLVSWVPNGSTDVASGLNMFQCSSLPHVIADVGSSTPVKFVIPWRTVVESLPIGNNDGVNRTIGSMRVWVLTPLISGVLATAPSVIVSIFARFINATVDAPTHAATSYPVLMSGRAVRESKRGKEAMEKSRTNLISGPATAVADFAGKLTDIPVVGGIASAVSAGARAVGGVASALGFDKPASLQPVTFHTEGSIRDLPLGMGLSPSLVMALDPAQKVSTSVDVISGDESERNIYSIMRIPHLIAAPSTAITSSSTVRGHYADYPVTPWHSASDCAGSKSYLAFISELFAYWRGDIKYLFRFVTTPFTTAKLMIAWIPEEDIIPMTISLEGIGNVAHLIFDVNGTTEVQFSVPYARTDMWCATYGRVTDDPTTYNGHLVVYVINPPSTADSAGSSAIYMQVFHAAGENFQVHQLLGPKRALDPTPPPKAVRECDTRQVFSRTFEPLVKAKSFADEGIVTSEKYGPLNDLLHRSCLVNGLTGAAGGVTMSFTQNGSGMQQTLLGYFSNIFRFMRGSIRWTITVPTTSTQWFMALQPSTFYGYLCSGHVTVTPAITPTVTVDIPYSGVRRGLDIQAAEAIGALYTIALTNLARVYIAGGDDFTFHVLYPCPLDYHT